MTKHNFDKLKFEIKNDHEGIAVVMISGLHLPKIPRFDPWGRIWASIRKINFEKFKVDVAGLFAYDEEKPVVACSFHLNCREGSEAESSVRMRIKRFNETFGMQMDYFKEVLVKFVDDPIGLIAYERLVERGNVDEDEADEVIDKFLIAYGIKRPSNFKKPTV